MSQGWSRRACSRPEGPELFGAGFVIRFVGHLPGIRRGRPTVSVAILLLSFAAVGCGRVTAPGGAVGLRNVTATPSHPVPWLDAAAPNVAQPFTLSGVPPCPASDLDVKVQGIYIGGGPKDTSIWQVRVKNKDTGPCFVGSTLDVAFVTSAGRLQMSQARTRSDIVYLAGLSGTSSTRFSRQAAGEIDTSCHMPTVVKMEISPAPGLGRVVLDPGPAGGWGVVCSNPESYLAELLPDDCCTGHATSTQTTIDAPAIVHPGDHVRFLIGIKNEESVHSALAGSVQPSLTPFTFPSCPTYHMELEGVANTLRTYTLNCRNVAPIQPHQIATFEMYIDVPRDAQVGPAVLLWASDGSPTIYQPARTSIEIVSESA